MNDWYLGTNVRLFDNTLHVDFIIYVQVSYVSAHNSWHLAYVLIKIKSYINQIYLVVSNVVCWTAGLLMMDLSEVDNVRDIEQLSNVRNCVLWQPATNFLTEQSL